MNPQKNDLTHLIDLRVGSLGAISILGGEASALDALEIEALAEE